MNEKIIKICPVFYDWPLDWSETSEDIAYGKKILEIMESFIEILIDNGCGKQSLKKHLSNLFWLGGKLMAELSLDEAYLKNVCDLILEKTDMNGELYRRATKSDLELFESTRWKFYGYLLTMRASRSS